jgi:transposase
MTLQQNYIGCDISKQFVDLFDPCGGHRRLANECTAIEGFAGSLRPGHDVVVLEATGRHDRLLRHALAARAVGHVRLNPVKARRFAQARGRLAKTDRIDARSLAAYGVAFQPACDAPPVAGRERLAALARRRDQLVDARANEMKHRADAFEPAVIDDIDAMIAVYDARIRGIETRIEVEMRSDTANARRNDRLRTAPGVGPVTALTLLAHMPELGSLSPKAAAALAGLAPFNDDSGQRKGRRSIAGGRTRVRQALYMAALGAIKANSRFKTFYTALAARSGSRKLALIAVARKLIVALNAMLRDDKPFA